MSEITRQCQGVFDELDRLIQISCRRAGHGANDIAASSGVMPAILERMVSVRVTPIERQTFLPPVAKPRRRRPGT